MNKNNSTSPSGRERTFIKLTDEQKALYRQELKTNDQREWNKEWVRLSNLEYELIHKYRLEGYKLVSKREDTLFELGSFPADCPWALLNGLSIAEAIETIFKPIANEVPIFVQTLQKRCMHIFSNKNELGKWELHYLLQKTLHDNRPYYTVITGGTPLPDARAGSDLTKHGWRLPEDLVALYAVHNGLGESEKNIWPDSGLEVMADIMEGFDLDDEYDQEYSYKDLLAISDDGGGNYLCLQRFSEDCDAVEVVDVDHETGELSEMGDLFSFINKGISNIDENSDDDDYEDDYEEEAIGLELIVVVTNNAEKEEATIIRKLEQLLEQGTDLEQKDDKGKTALVWASELGLLKTVQYLIGKGADVNAKDIDNGVPLFWAAYKGETEVVKLLIDHGAEVNVQDNNGDTALIFATMYWQYEMARLLVAYGADPNLKTNKGVTALELAGGHLKTMKCFLENGAHVNSNDLFGEIGRGRKVAIELLLDHGADINVKNSAGWTPLMYAVKNERYDICCLLLERGADRSLKNRDGQTALDIARSNNDSKIEKLLSENSTSTD